jgi:hypothetical protein
MRFASLKLGLLGLLIACGAASAHAQINPNTNIKWPNCAAGSTVYNITTNQCVPNGTGAGVGTAQGTAPIRVNGQSAVPATGNITIDCPNCGPNGSTIQMQYTPAGSGQYALVFAQACVVTAGSSATSCTANSGNLLGGGNSAINWNNYTLPSYILPANVTSIYEFAISQSNMVSAAQEDFGIANPGGGGVGSGTYFGVPHDLSGPGLNPYGLVEVTAPFTGLPTNYSAVSLVANRCCNGGGALAIALIGLEVHYTGAAPPATTSLQIQPPLVYNPTTNALGISAGWPNLLYVYPVAQLPAPAPFQAVAFVSDGATTTDCSTGGGSDFVLCHWNGSSWVGSVP